MAQAAAKTGVGPTALVAIEQYYPKEERIIEDNLAYRILPFSVRVFVRLARLIGSGPGWFEQPRKTLPACGVVCCVESGTLIKN